MKSIGRCRSWKSDEPKRDVAIDVELPIIRDEVQEYPRFGGAQPEGMACMAIDIDLT